jgi:DNA-directed RNA polymerase specialized sigma24 family protein
LKFRLLFSIPTAQLAFLSTHYAASTLSLNPIAKEAAQIAPIRDVSRYLFRVFLRKVADARRNETTYEDVSQWHSHPCDDSHGDGLDSQILLDQILSHFDSVTREMILRRIEGHSWGEIASEFETPLPSRKGFVSSHKERR